MVIIITFWDLREIKIKAAYFSLFIHCYWFYSDVI